MFEQMETQNIETSTSSMSVLNEAFKGFREQFNSNYPDDDIYERSDLFTNFADYFKDVVGDTLTEIEYASKKQKKNKNEIKNRKLIVKNEQALNHLKNYTKSVLKVFEDISSFIDSFASKSNLTTKDVAEHIENWNQNVNDLKEEIQGAVKSLNSAKEIFSTQDLSEQFSKIFNQLNDVIKHF